MLYAALSGFVLCLLLGLLFGWLLAARSASDAAHRFTAVAVDTLRSEQQESLRATVDTVMSLASSKLGDQLEAGKVVIERERDDVVNKVTSVETELRRVGQLVSSLQKERAQQAGELSAGIRQAMSATAALTTTTQNLKEALASSKARGQWGERMADDVLRAAGFIEGINYLRNTKSASGGVPDYTFHLPAERLVHMDVKFPADNYLRWLEAESSSEQADRVKAFRHDVRQRVKELTGRGYVDAATTVDYMLLFVPNESIYGFLHEHDPDLIDFALGHKVVLCSPSTLFVVLAVIRQAMDQFMVEKRSTEILDALAGLREQWDKWCEPMDKMARGLSSAQKAFDELSGPRSRQFEKQLERLEVFRDERADAAPPAGESRADRQVASVALRQVI